jgi:hypothetical protein
MRGLWLRCIGLAVALLAVFVGGCAESSDTFGTPAGMRARINELCDESRSSIDVGDVQAIRELADRIEAEVSDIFEDAVETSSELRRYAVAIESGDAPDPPPCKVDVLPLTGGG